MDQSWLKNHMCALGWISRSHARNGNEIQTSGHRGSAENIEKHGFQIIVNPKHAWKWWKNLAWCHVMVLPCCGKKIGRIGTSFGISFLQTSFSQEGSWFWEGTCHLCVWNDIRCPPLIFFTEATYDYISVLLNFGIIPGSFGLFYKLIGFLVI